ncbi:hypothetical protein [Dyella sp. RRB7]|uniref:hypothetical protein n=1 Tax=Dyella sp. RRB7 TaxID=2919502 RepID=UPI001FAAB447|nr:hypothetical protein [Dyella sp. RRB7]
MAGPSLSPFPMPQVPNLWRECAAILLRRPRPSALIAASYPAGERYFTASGPVSGILVPIVLVSLLGDIPLSFAVVAISHAAHPTLVHAVVLALGLLTLGWAVAARSVARSIPHVLADDALWMGGGARHAGVIPREAIRCIVPIQGSRHAWMRAHGLDRKDVLLASGFEPPNLAIELDDVAVGRCGMRRILRRWVLLYADRPAALASTAIPGRCT